MHHRTKAPRLQRRKPCHTSNSPASQAKRCARSRRAREIRYVRRCPAARRDVRTHESRGGTVDAGAIFAGFRIDRRIGAGGMGVVYLARHPRLDRTVALKVLGAGFATDPRARAAFEREADLIARLDHPNIVTVHDRSGPDDPLLWLSMQYVGGGDADGLLAAAPQGLPPERAVRLITDAAHALDFAHERGILHRDVKPANLLIDHDPRAGERALLTDFGIARTLDGTATVSHVAATLAYAAPERFSSGPTDHRADVYSLGCTLFHLLTGQTPFPRADQAAVIAAHLAEHVPPVTAVRPGVPPALETVIATALAKDPNHRYPTCGHLAYAAQEALRWPATAHIGGAHPGHPAVAAPAEPAPPTTYLPVDTRPGRTRRRALVAASAVATIVVLLAAAAVVFERNHTAAALPVSHQPGGPSTPVTADKFPTLDSGTGLGGSIALDASTHSIIGIQQAVSGHSTSISITDIASGHLTATIPIDGDGVQLAVDPGIHIAYVTTMDDAADKSSTVVLIDTVARTVAGSIPLHSSAWGVAVDTIRHVAFVAPTSNNTRISVIDPIAKSLASTIDVGKPAWNMAVDAPSDTAYLAAGDSLAVLDLASRTVTAQIKMPDSGSIVPTSIRSVAIDHDRSLVYAATEEFGVVIVDAISRTLVATVNTGTHGATQVVVDPSSHTVYAAADDNRVAVINPDSRAVTKTIATGTLEAQSPLTVDSATGTLYVAGFGAAGSAKILVVRP
ncbi:serine/threonine-protein kinase [Nocardia aurantiaca]|uniref:non-specific serine/threonine protein kinase n=1 Tax=Nocardia aurantiaca TaxID=2675850 RepID=A0A6I3L0H0_9NOCA|nr:serine/threonine-protein kinase [Nocardia aurantiaca]MTE14185.1 protein kinase [Nocardia aurantiaca]